MKAREERFCGNNRKFRSRGMQKRKDWLFKTKRFVELSWQRIKSQRRLRKVSLCPKKTENVIRRGREMREETRRRNDVQRKRSSLMQV